MPVLPWIPLYPDRDDSDVRGNPDDKSSTRVPTQSRVHAGVDNTVPDGYLFTPSLTLLFDIIQTYSILHLCVCEF
jgi:hypothetical protein